MKPFYICAPFNNGISNGPVAEWLGRALQKLVLRFESARDLKKNKRLPCDNMVAFFVLRPFVLQSRIFVSIEAALLAYTLSYL